MSEGDAIRRAFLCFVIIGAVEAESNENYLASSLAPPEQQCFVGGECSGILAGIAPENGADDCLTSVRTAIQWSAVTPRGLIKLSL